MIRTPLLSLCLAIAVGAPNVVGQEAHTTTWKGTLDAQGALLRLEIDVTERGGQRTGELRSLDQGNAKLKLSDVQIDGDSLSFSVPQAGAKFVGKLANNGAAAEGTFSQGGVKLPLTLAKSGTKIAAPEQESREELQEAWVGKLEINLLKPVMQFRIVTLESGETAAYFDSVTEGRTGFEATWSIDGDAIAFDVEAIKLSYRGTLNEARDAAEGTWSQGGREVPLTLKRQTAPYDSVNVWEKRPQRPVGPFPYDAQEVTFENEIDGLTLAGTLTIPHTPGRHPVVVLISGSGPQDRDESLMEHKPFLVLADYLTRRGVAVLRYDDRGTAQSTGEFDGATTEDFARDASAAVEFLKRHDRIDPQEIGLAGHSEGGLVAPMVVGLRDDVAFVVLLAATGVDGATIIRSQTEAMLRAAGTEDAEIKIALDVNRAALDVVMKAEPGTDFFQDLDQAVEDVIQSLPESDREEAGKNIRAAIRTQRSRLQGDWVRFFLSYDPRPALTNIQCPVLAITGSKDTQVVPELNVPEIRQALTQGGNQDFEIIELEGLNHLLQQCETGALSEYLTIQETVNPLALERIGDWIIDRTTPSE